MMKVKEKIKDIKCSIKSKKKVATIYLILRTLVIICMLLEFFRGDIFNAFLCLLSLILFILPYFIEKRFKIDLPNTLEVIIMLFIFSAEILGEINNFYGIIPYWDSILHTLNGFLAAAVGFALFDLLNDSVKGIHLSPIFLSIVAFCFSMTIGILWEFFEYGMDKYFNMDMQKDEIINSISSVKLNNDNNETIIIDNIKYSAIYNVDKNNEEKITIINNGYLDIGLHDTMKDLFVNFIGAFIFSIFGYLYIHNKEKYKFIDNFIPVKVSDDKS